MVDTPASDMSDPQFTDAALALLADANRVADRLCHEYIGTEHVVLALTERDIDIVTAVFERTGVDRRKVNQTLTNMVATGSDQSATLARPYTSRTRRSFAFATDSARDMGQSRVAPEHLLLGILREGRNIGAQVLADQGLTVEAATHAITHL